MKISSSTIVPHKDDSQYQYIGFQNIREEFLVFHFSTDCPVVDTKKNLMPQYGKFLV